MQPNLTLLVLIAGAVGGAASAIIGGCFTLWNNWDARQSEERRQIRELAVKVATENWRHQTEIGKEWAQAGAQVTLSSLDVYLIHAMSLVKALDGSVRTPEQVAALLRESHAMYEAAKKEVAARKKN